MKIFTLSGNSNGNESPCSNDITDNQTLSASLTQISQPIGVHTQSLTSFGQNTLHNPPGIHSYTSHNTKTFGHQPFYGWY